MRNEKLEIIYQDSDLLVIDKPAGIVVFSEEETHEETLIDLLVQALPYLNKAGVPPRYGIVHRLDKDTSGILLVAKNTKSLLFFQEQFQKRQVLKKYIALIQGDLRKNRGRIETLIGRDPKNRIKQKVYLPFAPNSEGKRTALTEYKVIKRFSDQRANMYTLVEAIIETGRRHQIRIHLSYLGHPVAGDSLYGFKNQPLPQGLKRQFLHASFLKIKFPNNKQKEFESELPEDLAKALANLKDPS